jgi:hypothetical protein
VGKGDLGGCLEALERMAEGAEQLGLDAGAARETLASARTRLGFPGTAFVCALAGGTGAGKSSLLNALAGREVSRPGATRPVTAEPVAWVPADAAAELGPLLRWVGVDKVVSHHDPRFTDLCLLDLPDSDSVEAHHRATVDQVLPRVDAVCWVLDPEKYNDRVLHEDYLRPLAHHADRAVFALNRADTLDPEVVGDVVADVRRAVEADGYPGRPVLAVSANPGTGRDTGELDRLRAWLSERMEAKTLVTRRLADECVAAGEAIGRTAGTETKALVDPKQQAAARDRAVAAARSAVDVGGVRTACVRRARAEARASGAGPVGRVLGWLARRRGGGTDPDRSVDPVAYARGWRQRASLARAVNPVRELARQAASAAPPALRPSVMRRAGPDRLEERLAAAVDDAVARATADSAAPPRSLLWPLIGVLQAVCLGAVLLGVLWLATLWLAGQARADLPELPGVLGVPWPVVLIGGGLVAGILLGRVLEASAVTAGNRWARRLTRALDKRVAAEVERATEDPLTEIEAARDKLRTAVAELRVAGRAS